MFHLKIDLFLIYLIIVNNYVRSAPEPLCSKFSYDEQLLEKMVRVEFNVNNMEKNMLETEMSMRKTEETMQETDRSMRETHANMMDTERKIQEAQQKMAETHADIMTAQKKMQENLADINENIKLLEQKDEMLEAKRGKDVVAFRAHKVADKSVADNQVFVFTKVVLNEGSGYSSTSGYFTAPVSGIYFFNSQLCGLTGIFYACEHKHITKMMFQVKMRSCTLSLLFLCVHARSAPEPLCSKFSYDEQLLEKMVRVEFNVNNMEKNMLETETRIKETEQKMEETRTELMGTKDTVLNTLKEINEKLKLLEQKRESDLTGKDVVAFHAHKIADKSVAVNQVFVFTEVLLNEGSGYASTNGYFTAPVSGIYFFNCHLCVQNKKDLQYIFVVNGKKHASGLFTSNGTGRCTSFSVTVRIRSGERAWVSIDENGSSSVDLLYEDSDDWNYFSGFLVRQTT